MCDKIPFFTFFESFVPPRDLGLLLHDACVVGGLSLIHISEPTRPY